jgi:hypothetical protein
VKRAAGCSQRRTRVNSKSETGFKCTEARPRPQALTGALFRTGLLLASAIGLQKLCKVLGRLEPPYAGEHECVEAILRYNPGAKLNERQAGWLDKLLCVHASDAIR